MSTLNGTTDTDSVPVFDDRGGISFNGGRAAAGERSQLRAAHRALRSAGLRFTSGGPYCTRRLQIGPLYRRRVGPWGPHQPALIGRGQSRKQRTDAQSLRSIT